MPMRRPGGCSGSPLITGAAAGGCYIQAMLGHARLDTTQIYAQVSVTAPPAIHAATHPPPRHQPPPGARRAATRPARPPAVPGVPAAGGAAAPCWPRPRDAAQTPPPGPAATEPGRGRGGGGGGPAGPRGRGCPPIPATALDTYKAQFGN